jgi:hypothetical protein
LRTDLGYDQVFNNTHPLELYSFCAELVRSVEKFLTKKTKSRKDRNNLKFYVAFVAARLLAGKEKTSAKDLVALSEGTVQQQLLDTAYAYCRKKYDTLGGDDDVARGSLFIKRVQGGLKSLLAKNKRFKAPIKKKK